MTKKIIYDWTHNRAFFIKLKEELGVKRNYITPLIEEKGGVKKTEGVNEGSFFIKGCILLATSPGEEKSGVYIKHNHDDEKPLFLEYNIITYIKNELGDYLLDNQNE